MNRPMSTHRRLQLSVWTFPSPIRVPCNRNPALHIRAKKAGTKRKPHHHPLEKYSDGVDPKLRLNA